MRNRQNTETVNRPAPSSLERAAHHLRGLRNSLRSQDPVNAHLHATRLERAMQTGTLSRQSTITKLLDKARAMALPGGNPLLLGGIE